MVVISMALLSLEEVSRELSVSIELIRRLIANHVITPYGGKARLGEPRFSRTTLPNLRATIEQHLPKA